MGADKKKEEKKEKMTPSKKHSPKAHHGGKRSPKHAKKTDKPKAEGFDVMGTEYLDSMGPEPAGNLVASMGGEAKGSENFSLLDSSPF
jgi:hypothetical protein